jgi:hypothetical protein
MHGLVDALVVGFSWIDRLMDELVKGWMHLSMDGYKYRHV